MDMPSIFENLSTQQISAERTKYHSFQVISLACYHVLITVSTCLISSKFFVTISALILVCRYRLWGIMRRFYIYPDRVERSDIYLSGPEARHLRTVLRLSVGEKVVLFDGTDNEYDARIVSFKSGRVDLRITATRSSSTEPQVKLTIAQALLKKRKMDGLVRQLTELGIHHWRPFIARRSIPRPTQAKNLAQTARWKTIATEAVKQCRRGSPPIISHPISFDDILVASKDDTVKVVLWERATEPLINRLPAPPLPGNQQILLMLGPEGGFSEAEIKAAKIEGFVTASLGPRILRAETAALTACVLVLHHLNDLG